MKQVKQIVAFALLLCMVLGLLPGLALAAGPEGSSICTDGHTPANPVREHETAAACTADGSYQAVVYCSVCKQELSRETVTVSALGHQFGEAQEVLNPGAKCTAQENIRKRICARCGEEKTEPVTGTCPETALPDGRPVGHWAHYYIDYVLGQKLMTGDKKGTFRPTDSMTRAELVTVLWRMSGSPQTAFAALFKDVRQGQWFAEAVTWAANHGIVNGMGNRIFAPNENVTRDQIALIFLRYTVFSGYQIPESASLSSFKDASKVEAWAKAAVEWAVGSSLISGNKDGTLCPLASATREELATILTRYNKGKDSKTALLDEAACAHNWRILSQKKPTCELDGSISQICNLCGKMDAHTEKKLGHAMTSTNVKPTCTTEGYTLNRCNRCGFSSKTDICPALGHDYFEGKCTNYGCGQVEPSYAQRVYESLLGTWTCYASHITDNYGQWLITDEIDPEATMTINRDYTAVIKLAGHTYKITDLTYHERDDYFTGAFFDGTLNGKSVRLIVDSGSGGFGPIQIEENYRLFTHFTSSITSPQLGREFTFVK